MFHFSDISTTLLRFYSSFLDVVIVEFFLTSEKKEGAVCLGDPLGEQNEYFIFLLQPSLKNSVSSKEVH